jgi:RTX calcium-binding nonapeptide repeat (4 copies)
MFTTIKGWLHDHTGPAKPRRARLAVEPLADRTLPSAVLVDGTLTIAGTGRHDVDRVSREFVLGSWWIRVSEQTRVGATLSPVSASVFREADVTQIVFRGRDGDDRFTNITAIPSCANGGDGRDTMFGGTGSDVLCGDAGKDYLYGRDGADVLNGNGGDDFLVGGAGADRLSGGDGWDILLGNTGNDFLCGDDGRDTMDGGAGSDRLDGGTDDQPDLLVGGPDGDTFVRHRGRLPDRIVGFVPGVDRIEVI